MQIITAVMILFSVSIPVCGKLGFVTWQRVSEQLKSVLVAHWLKHSIGVTEFVDSIPTWNSENQIFLDPLPSSH